MTHTSMSDPQLQLASTAQNKVAEKTIQHGQHFIR